LGRFFAIDPLAKKYPHNSVYAFSENIVINAREFEGLEKVYVYNIYFKFGFQVKKLSHTYIDENLTNYQRKYQYFDSNGKVIKDKTKVQDIPDHERDPSKNFYDNMIDGSWNDGHYWDVIVWSTKKKEQAIKDPWEGGKLIAATVGVILSGGTLAAASGVTGTLIAGVGMVFSLDDLTAIGEEDSFFEKTIRDNLGDEAASMFKGAKLAISVHDAAKGITNLSFQLATGEIINGTFNVIDETLTMGTETFTISETIKTAIEDEKK
jgi:hypothetical protein